jgi:N-acetylmuramoyl-L-alanine amidase
MRQINFITVHCTGTPNNATVESIKNYWKNFEEWRKPGYHYIIDKNGIMTQLLPISEISNGVQWYNHEIINVAYIGGINSAGKYTDTRTEFQKETLLIILRLLKKQFPEAVICGHRDFRGVNKQCPCFNAITEYNDI